MEATTIKKCLNLLKNLDLRELETVLNTEYIKATASAPTKAVKLLNAVKKAITNKREPRAALTTVQHTDDGAQFICDGFIIALFKNYEPTLDALPQTASAQSINVKKILQSANAAERQRLTDDERAALENIGKFEKIAPKGKNEIINIFGGYYNVKLLKKLIDITGTPTEYATTQYLTEFETDTARAAICSVRIKTDEEKNAINETTKEFLKAFN